MRTITILFIAILLSGCYCRACQAQAEVTGVQVEEIKSLARNLLNSQDPGYGQEALLDNVLQVLLGGVSLPSGTQIVSVSDPLSEALFSTDPAKNSLRRRLLREHGKLAVRTGVPTRNWALAYPVIRADAASVVLDSRQGDALVNRLDTLNSVVTAEPIEFKKATVEAEEPK